MELGSDSASYNQQVQCTVDPRITVTTWVVIGIRHGLLLIMLLLYHKQLHFTPLRVFHFVRVECKALRMIARRTKQRPFGGHNYNLIYYNPQSFHFA
jgi:hypothetical protein